MKPTTSAYLTKRLCSILGVDKLQIKDLPLDMLMTAYSVKVGDERAQDNRITLEVPALATHYAKRLSHGKFVVFRDPTDNVIYHVVARGNDLIAVFYTIGPWLNIYSIICSSDVVLREVGITASATMDKRVIDGIFGFADEDHQKPVEGATATLQDHSKQPHWKWHSARQVTRERVDSQADQNDMVEIEASLQRRDPAGEPASTTLEGQIEAARVNPGNQMHRAFVSANQQQQGRRAQDQRIKGQQPKQTAHSTQE